MNHDGRHKFLIERTKSLAQVLGTFSENSSENGYEGTSEYRKEETLSFLALEKLGTLHDE